MAGDALTIDLIPTGQAIVDPDFAEVGGQQLKWRLDTRTTYRPRAYTYVRIRGKYTKIYLERFVMTARKGKYVRFRNGVTLDCRKANLVIVKWCSEVALLDQQRRIAWKFEEAGRPNTSPQRRRTEAWRMWCEENKPEQIAKVLRSSLQTIKQDIIAMAGNPLAAEPETERATPKH